MFNSDFYPTPEKVIQIMLSTVQNRDPKSILEPSAGKGNIIGGLIDWLKCKKYVSEVSCLNLIHCIEKDPELQHFLMGKGYNLIDTDFLTYSGRMQFDLIIMNPPFSQGVKHLLKAWNILYSGEIVCLLNWDTISNPKTKEEILLHNIISNNGYLKSIEKCFIDAERTTNAEIALVYLSKNNNVEVDYFENLKEEQNISASIKSSVNINEIVERDLVLIAEKDYNIAIDKMIKAYIAAQEAHHYVSRVMDKYNFHEFFSDLFDNGVGKSYTQNLIKVSNNMITCIKRASWLNLINKGHFTRYLSSSQQKDFNSKIDKLVNVEFSQSNIYQIILNLIGNQRTLIDKSLLDAFDLMVKFHKDNIEHYEGWKTNCAYRVKTKVIIPYYLSFDKSCVNYSGTLMWKINDYRAAEVNDIDKTLSYLSDSKSYTTIYEAITNAADTDRGNARDCESTFFKIRFFKKGTIHLMFKSDELLRKLNFRVGLLRNWIPPCEFEEKQESKESYKYNGSADIADKQHTQIDLFVS